MISFVTFLTIFWITTGVLSQENPVNAVTVEHPVNASLQQQPDNTTVTLEKPPAKRFLEWLTPENGFRRYRLGLDDPLSDEEEEVDNLFDEEDDDDEISLALEKLKDVIPREIMKRKLVETRDTDLNVTTPIFSYATCNVGNGIVNNPSCRSDMVCVDKDTMMPVECPMPGGMCGPCPPADPCPRGCKPGTGCPPLTGPDDGVCTDPKRPIEEYQDDESTTLKPPTVLQRGQLKRGDGCSVYGDTIYNDKITSKEICNWHTARLECIPNDPRGSTTTDASNPPSEAEQMAYDRPPGTCQCMTSLTKHAVIMMDTKTGNEICFIPANRGESSACDHEINFPPFGPFEGVKPGGKPVERTREPASKFCVPYSECRIGEKFTGKRCMCREGTIFDANSFTCSSALNVRIDFQVMCLTFLIYILGHMNKF